MMIVSISPLKLFSSPSYNSFNGTSKKLLMFHGDKKQRERTTHTHRDNTLSQKSMDRESISSRTRWRERSARAALVPAATLSVSPYMALSFFLKKKERSKRGRKIPTLERKEKHSERERDIYVVVDPPAVRFHSRFFLLLLLLLSLRFFV
jgi:hypothetical protein